MYVLCCNHGGEKLIIRNLFILSFCVLTYLLGGLSVTFEMFPYQWFSDAKLAYEALEQAVPEEILTSRPTKFEGLEEDGLTGPTVLQGGQCSVGADELILVNGGYYQMMSECPNFGCLAWIMERDGSIRHVWEVDPQEVWGDVKRIAGFNQPDNMYPAGMHLYENGDLLVVFQARNTYPYAVGIARFDKDSNLLWKVENYGHHWPSVDDDGLIYVPSLNPVDSPLVLGDTSAKVVCGAKKIYEDLIRVYSPDGKLLKSISVTQALLKSGYIGLVYEGNRSGVLEYDECDPTHLNDVRVLSRDIADQYPGLNAGDILVSMRNNNTVAVIDKHTELIKMVLTGKTLLQHSPSFIGSGRIAVFDNNGGPKEKGGSRILSIDLLNGEVKTLFPRSSTPKDVDFYTHNGGRLVVHPSGSRALVSLTRRGRVVEVDFETGKVLWEYVNTHDLGPYLATKGDLRSEIYARFTTSGAYYVINPKFSMNRN